MGRAGSVGGVPDAWSVNPDLQHCRFTSHSDQDRLRECFKGTRIQRLFRRGSFLRPGFSMEGFPRKADFQSAAPRRSGQFGDFHMMNGKFLRRFAAQSRQIDFEKCA